MDAIASSGFLRPMDSMAENRSLTDKFMLRLPDGMRDQLAAEAKENNRSTNAEIVSRLERSLSGYSGQMTTMVELTLDTSGMPTSWGEILEHLGALTRASKLEVVTMNATIVTPELLSSRGREAEAAELSKRYRKLARERSKKAPST